MKRGQLLRTLIANARWMVALLLFWGSRQLEKYLQEIWCPANFSVQLRNYCTSFLPHDGVLALDAWLSNRAGHALAVTAGIRSLKPCFLLNGTKYVLLPGFCSVMGSINFECKLTCIGCNSQNEEIKNTLS